MVTDTYLLLNLLLNIVCFRMWNQPIQFELIKFNTYSCFKIKMKS